MSGSGTLVKVDNYKIIFDISLSASSLSIERVRTFDVSNIPGLAFHPACVILVALTNLRTETSLRSGNRDSVSRDSPTNDVAKSTDAAAASASTPSIILNICGRVVMIQTEAATGDQAAEQAQQMVSLLNLTCDIIQHTSCIHFSNSSHSCMIMLHRHCERKHFNPQMMPTVLASCCETIWFPRDMDPDKPHLTASLWLYCGAHGMKVWLPVFPREGDHGHTFMSKRIMLHFPIDKLYPLGEDIKSSTGLSISGRIVLRIYVVLHTYILKHNPHFDVKNFCTDMQEKMMARLRESRLLGSLWPRVRVHAT